MTFDREIKTSFVFLSKDDILKIKTQLLEDLRNYYKNLGKLIEETQLANFAKGDIYATKIVPKEAELLVAESTNFFSKEIKNES